ncbi:MAG: cyclic nucleotide-binding domain-containing protein [Proteobacteria bacterium]|nr:cyclic nucleotide-binding domain-containing protein [Pseudomonadota bacterium]
MLDDVINNPDLNRYLTSFETGQTIMVEGDDSQDLYILISGELEILKGSKKIWEIAERGAIFGEMSFLMGSKRTATVKAKDDVEAICIPRKNITAFLSEFPGVSREIAKFLAERLGEASQILHGLKEFCDQLPDAVLLTDKDGNISSWNTAAENLYGLDWHEMHNKSVEDIYVEPQAYRDFLDEVQARYSVREKILKIKHPEKGTRFVSTSTTVLYDGHHNFKGVLSLGRDVTAVQNLERRYRRARYWLLPSFILLGLLSAAIFFGYPYFSKGFETMDVKKKELRNQLAKDYVLLKSLLADHFAAGDRYKTSQLMKEFFDVQENTSIPYTGLILLDENKKVFDAYSNTETENKNMVDSSYAGIDFRGSERSIHRVLSLYRTHKDHPMGCKGIEVAFEIRKDNQVLGWLVFQMDMDLLEKAYDLDEESLKKFQFRPQNP